MPNKRVYYAVYQCGFAKIGTQTFTAVHGLQSFGMSTNYNLDPQSEVGQLAIYVNLEQLPDVEIQLEKVLDGYPLMWHLATNGATDGSLAGRSNISTIFGAAFFDDTKLSASGTPISEVQCSGMFPSSHSLSFPVQGSFRESMSLIGNNKVWNTSAPFKFSGQFLSNNDTPLAGSTSGQVNQRQNLVMAPAITGLVGLDANSQSNAVAGPNRFTVLPPDITGISSSGVNNQTTGVFGAHIQNISCSVNLGREPLYELGRRAFFHRYVTFPVEVTSDIEVLATDGDLVSATDTGILGNGNNLNARTIKIATQEGTFVNLGLQNKLKTINYGGGDTGGGNLTITYSYSTYNDYTISHISDPSGMYLA